MTRFVFGSGIALVNNWKLIKKYFNPQYCVDNNSSRWGVEENTKLMCMGPEKMITYDNPKVLITVGDPYAIESISRQLEGYGVDYLVMTDLLSEWGEQEPLPMHLKPMLTDKNKKVILFNTPMHDNIGDYLIGVSEMKFLKERFKDYSIYEVTDIEYLWFGKILKEYINSNDIILITGGGFLGSLWLYNGENNVRQIINDYRDNKIIILPQTIYFEDNERGKIEYNKTLKAYNRAKNLTVIFREEQSFRLIDKEKNRNFKIDLIPDMALFYDANIDDTGRQNMVLVCLRADKESVFSDADREYIMDTLSAQGYKIKEISMHSKRFPGLENRMDMVNDKLNEISKAKLVITDTLHCMVSATITGTPCIAFDNLSGKVKNVYKWIESLGYVRFCEDVSELNQLLNDNIKPASYVLNNKDMYLDKLEGIIRHE